MRFLFLHLIFTLKAISVFIRLFSISIARCLPLQLQMLNVVPNEIKRNSSFRLSAWKWYLHLSKAFVIFFSLDELKKRR